MAALSRRTLLTLSAAASLGLVRTARAAEAMTTAGAVAGAEEAGVRVWRGIPFAQPPVGALRFRPPLPPLPWAEVRPARAFAAAPIQAPAPYLAQGGTSEDCLYLNVWAPADGKGHPVFVWFYGGGNVAGATSQPIYDGTRFARDGVVCVTVAYREGAFGFLELGALLGGPYAGSANVGLKDQVLALRWVRDNIAGFGGDPGRVTIAGESAGAKDVCGLLGAPAAAALFHRAIIESGSGQTVFARPAADAIGEMFLQASGVERALAADLCRLAPAQLLAAEQEVTQASPVKFPFRPVIDGRFLPLRPVHAVAQGAARGKALLLGSNRDESVLFLTPEAAAGTLPQRALSNMDAKPFAALDAAYRHALPTLSESERHWRMLTAEEYWIPTLRVAEAQVAAGGEAFFYRFDRGPRDGKFAGKAYHSSELPYVWDNTGDPNWAGVGGDDPALRTAMHAAWVAFIRDGKPAAAGLPEWPAFSLDRRATMLLDDAPKLAFDPNAEERRLWEGVL
jgi:para-nitrobenzyl esterase